MPALRILSGGAAQGVVYALAARLEATTGFAVGGEFGAVGIMAAKLRAGDEADLVILTADLIAALRNEGQVRSGPIRDIGLVETGVAVRRGDDPPSIGDAEAFRAALLAADAIFIPDHQQSTAGVHMAKVMRSLGIWGEVEGRLRTFPNGASAMSALAAADSPRPIGCTQVTEILNTAGVALVGPLPPGCELATTYTAAVGARARSPAAAEILIGMLSSVESLEQRTRAGFRELS